MKTESLKIFAAAAMSVLAIACAKENTGAGVDAGVSFSIEVPGTPATKAEIGDGETATKLYYQVFNEDGTVIDGLGVQHKTLTGKEATVNFQLVKDQTYKFVFWAQTAADGYYTIDNAEGLRKITANYADKKSNDENFDAFYAVEKITVTGPVSKTVNLKRPFAQINIATAGQISAGTATKDIDFTDAASAVTVKNIPNVFSPLATTDVFTGNADVTFEKAEAPAGNITVNGKTYKYLAVNYVFAPADGTVYDLNATLKVEGKDVSLTVPTVPAKQNWRTNIVGDLLTAGTDFTVVVDPGFSGGQTVAPMFVNGVGYQTLDAAVAAVPANGEETIIKIGQDIAGNGIVTDAGQNVVIDLGGNTFNIDGEMVGSASTVTNGHQFKKGSKVTIKNGTVKSTKAYILIQNYADLTLENVVLDASESTALKTGTYVLSNNYGSIKILGSTSIYARSGKFAFDVCYWAPAYEEGLNVYVNTTGVIDGAIEYSCYRGNVDEEASKTRSSLVIDNAVLTNSSFKTTLKSPNIKVASGVFADETAANAWVPDGYKATKIGGCYVVTTNDITPVVDQAGLDSTLNTLLSTTEPATVKLFDGTYVLPELSGALSNVTFEGNGSTVFDLASVAYMPADNRRPYDDVTFKNIKFTTWSGNYCGFRHSGNLTFDSCTFTGMHFGYGAKEIYKNCTFNQTKAEYHMWTYGGNIDYIGCTFNGKGKFLHVYNEIENGERLVINVENCKFNNTGSEGKPAINIKGRCDKDGREVPLAFEVNIKNCKLGDGAFPSINGGLWQVDNPVSDMTLNKVKVTVDDTVVYPAE